jgi:LmbE family N-acetylglucosaminyl deacetylase
VRLEESEESAKLLGVNEIIYMGYLDRGLACDEKTIEQALAQLRLHQPDLVLAFEFHHRATPYPHPDHMAAANIVRNAIARYEQRDQLDYYVCSSLLPNRFVDVSATRRVKLEALACHTTQSGLNSVIFPFFEKMMTRLWGVYAGVDYAEGYRKVNIPEMIKRLESA